MAVLTTKTRNALPEKDFAGPDRSFPIPDANHARNALARAHFAANPGAIRAAVHRKFPGIGGAVRDAVRKRLKSASDTDGDE